MEKLDPETPGQGNDQEKNVAAMPDNELAEGRCKLTCSWVGRSVLGIVLGGLAGYALHVGVGCPAGTCPITANPWTSALYCAILGFVVAQIGCCSRKRQSHC